ncbi:MAG: hypothetical protein ACE5E1_08705 [Phycisphaerae bacterium]
MSRRAAALVAILLCGVAWGGCGTSARGFLGALRGGGGTIQFPTQGGAFGSNPPRQEVGACCLPSGDCLTVTASDCASFSGFFQGEGLTCGVAPCGELF